MISKWWQAQVRPREAYALAAVIGLAVYVCVFGPAHLFGMGSYWELPATDQRAYLIGYRYFLQEPWHWPIFASRTMNLPYRESIAFTDSIPLWAFANKAIATVIPPWKTFTIHAYLGLWYGLVYAFQACFGVAILRQLGHRSRGAAIVTALFFVTVPAWVLRYFHASLSAHFLTLAGFLLYLRTPRVEMPARRLIAQWLALLACAALINPYHTVMAFGLFTVALLRTKQLRAAAWFPAGGLVIGVAAWLGGYFSGEAAAHMPGFDSASTNLLSMIVPTHSTFFGDGTWLANVCATEFQYEGWAYLGLGLLILLACYAPYVRTLGATVRRHPYLMALLVATMLLALSNHIYFGSHLIIGYELPAALSWVTDQFRAPGRFVWLPMYAVVIYLVHWGFTRFASGWKQLVLPALALIQLADVGGAWAWLLSVTDHGRHEEIVPLDPWRQLILAHDAVNIYPSYLCVLDGTPNIDRLSVEFEFVAAERALPINGVFSARPTRNCEVDRRAWGSIDLQPNTMYILLPLAKGLAPRLAGLGATCGAFEYGLVCSTNPKAIADAIGAGTLTPSTIVAPTLEYDHHIVMAQASPYLGDGWSWGETWGRWSDGKGASLVVHLDGTPVHGALQVRATAPICGRRTSEDVDVLIDGIAQGTLHFDKDANDLATVRTISIADRELLARPIVVVDFRPRDYRPPKLIKCNAETRELAIGVVELWFE